MACRGKFVTAVHNMGAPRLAFETWVRIVRTAKASTSVRSNSTPALLPGAPFKPSFGLSGFCARAAILFLLLTTIVLHAFTQPSPDSTRDSGSQQVALGNSSVKLTGPWKFHIGDSPDISSSKIPLWAQSSFDDANWQSIDLTVPKGSVDPGLGTSGYLPGWTAGHPGQAGYAWYRLRVHVTGKQRPLALLMPIDVDDGYQVYCNGQLLGEFGNFSHHPPRTYYGQPLAFRLPVPAVGENAPQDFVLALRFYMKPADLLEDPTPGGFHGPPRLGVAIVIADYYRLQRAILVRTYNFYSIPILVYLLAGLAAFALFIVDRTQRVFLWLSAAGWMNAIYLIFTLSAILTTLIDDRLLILRPVLFSIVLWTWLMTMYVWLELEPIHWLRHAIHGLTAIHIALQLAQGLLFGRTAFPFLLSGFWQSATAIAGILIALLPVVMLYYAWSKRSREGQLATFALVFLLLAVFPRPLEWLHVPLLWFVFGVQISTRVVMELAVWVWVFLLFIARFQRSQHEQHQLQNEMRQAQQVQHMLCPEPTATLPGFHIETVYRPAAEVGGDFFQILPDGSGGLLVVVGDVSGKGLRAAMLVSLIVGTLRTFAEQDLSPGELLHGMNRRLHKRMEGGFATCICAHITADGKITLANAGHVPPYLNGEEMTVPADLPLGIVPDIQYEEFTAAVPPGGRLVFLTDGIVEARNRKHELYGFERTKILVRRPVEEIVHTAQRFGQEDDITVVDLIWDRELNWGGN